MTWQELMASIPDDCELTIRFRSKTAPIPNAITLRLREHDEFGERVEVFITGEVLDHSVMDGVGMIGMVLRGMKHTLTERSNIRHKTFAAFLPSE